MTPLCLGTKLFWVHQLFNVCVRVFCAQIRQFFLLFTRQDPTEPCYVSLLCSLRCLDIADQLCQLPLGWVPSQPLLIFFIGRIGFMQSYSRAYLVKQTQIGWSVRSNWTLYAVIPRSLWRIRLNDLSKMFNCWEYGKLMVQYFFKKNTFEIYYILEVIFMLYQARKILVFWALVWTTSKKLQNWSTFWHRPYKKIPSELIAFAKENCILVSLGKENLLTAGI